MYWLVSRYRRFSRRVCLVRVAGGGRGDGALVDFLAVDNENVVVHDGLPWDGLLLEGFVGPICRAGYVQSTSS